LRIEHGFALQAQLMFDCPRKKARLPDSFKQRFWATNTHEMNCARHIASYVLDLHTPTQHRDSHESFDT
jgi:hypothetical protein